MTIPHSAALKLARGSEHLDALKREVAAFEQDKPYGIREQIDEDRTQRTFYLVERRPFPEKVGLMIGDCTHNFRCVLDHLAFNLPRGAGTDPRWEGWSQFPITNDPAKFASRKNDTLGVDPAVLAVIESLQPYVGRNNPAGHPLWYLRELSNFDKHRLLRFAALIRTGVAIEIPRPATGTVRPVWAEGAVEHDAIIGKLYYSDPSPPGGEMNITLSMGITIAEIEPAIGIQTALEAIHNAVEDVATRLDPFL